MMTTPAPATGHQQPATGLRWAVPLVIAMCAITLSGGAAAAMPPASQASLSGGTADDMAVAVDQTRLEAVARYLADARTGLRWPGLAAALVAGDRVVWSAGYGVAEPGGREVTADTPFLLASLSKSITAVAVMRLVQAGRVGLDDPVTTHLPELAPAGDGITVGDLMVQRTGLTEGSGRSTFAGAAGASLEASVGRLGPELRQGAGFEYSNANYDALALVVQRAAGRSFEDYLQDEVFGPLGMQATTDPARARAAGLATGYYRWLGLGYRPHSPPQPDGMVGSYRMYASATAIAQMLLLHLGDGRVDGRQVLTPASLATLHAGKPIDGSSTVAYGGGLFIDAPGSPWMQGAIADYPMLRHDGSAPSYRSYLWAMPGADLGLVLLVNANDWSDESQLARVAHNVSHILFDVPPGPMAGEPDPLIRWGKHLFALVALVQLLLAAGCVRPTLRALRGVRLTRASRTWIIAAGAMDLVALACLLWLVPAVTGAPIQVVAQAPDARIILTVMALGVVWGAIRTALLLAATLRRPTPEPA